MSKAPKRFAAVDRLVDSVRTGQKTTRNESMTKLLKYVIYSTAPGYRDLALRVVDADGQDYELRLNPDEVQNLIFACAEVARQIGDHPPIDWDQFPRTITWPQVTTWKPGPG